MADAERLQEWRLKLSATKTYAIVSNERFSVNVEFIDALIDEPYHIYADEHMLKYDYLLDEPQRWTTDGDYTSETKTTNNEQMIYTDDVTERDRVSSDNDEMATLYDERPLNFNPKNNWRIIANKRYGRRWMQTWRVGQLFVFGHNFM